MDGNLNKVATFLLSACLVVCIGATVYLAVSPKVGERFTEFYILGPSGKAEGYPTNLMLGECGTVIIGVVNHEYEKVKYRIVVKLDNSGLDVAVQLENVLVEAAEIAEGVTAVNSDGEIRLEIYRPRVGCRLPKV